MASVVDVDTSAAGSSSSSGGGDNASSSRIDLHVPSNLLIVPAAAAVVGFALGMRREGGKARLRFLAENAHRQPTTVQGWYFYTKTRNYRVFFAGLRGGSKYALGLGTAAALFVAVDEGVGYLRERLLDPAITREDARTPPNPRREGWRKGPVHWEDGAIAGSTLAVVTALVYKLPNPLLLRALIMGFTLGGVTSALQIGQDKISAMKDEEDRQKAAAEAAEAAAAAVPAPAAAAPVDSETAAPPPTPTLVDAAEPAEPPAPAPAQGESSSWLGRVGSWAGLGKA
ncbi:uncharacterized protein LOC62_07G009084 [Vanrija pseudolonga]|uniref:Uncharacterized protein n=1 Tax=Vanrija pseudolonga TaxID=143232 RepID=A0AAF0YKY3_9TREE|nr:hypothetical protein LOC62_07G009084 [Vanrija pseudolonga]